MVIAYAIAGTVDIDFELEPLGIGLNYKYSIFSKHHFLAGQTKEGKPVYLRDIWPSRGDIQEVERNSVLPAMFADVYKGITSGNEQWNSLEAPAGMLYPWDSNSTYIKRPPFFDGMTKVNRMD